MSRLQRTLAAAIIASIACGCSAATTAGTFPTAPRDHLSQLHLFVMPPASEGSPATGNIGRDFSDIERVLAMRLLAVVQERDPGARMADVTGQTPFLPMARYIDAVAPARTTRNEITAAGFALQHGGTHLLVPTIIEWREMRTDDPVGGLIAPHNGVVIALRLVRLDPLAVEGNVRFENRSRFTANQSADRLLNEDFRRTLLRLLGGGAGQPHAEKQAGAHGHGPPNTDARHSTCTLPFEGSKTYEVEPCPSRRHGAQVRSGFDAVTRVVPANGLPYQNRHPSRRRPTPVAPSV